MQFVHESGTVNENGEAVMAANPTSPPKRNRRTKAEIARDKGAQLQAVFRALKKQDMSLSEFLCNTFTSPQENIKSKVGQFYATNGPARILQIWGEDLDGRDGDVSLTKAAIELVGERIQTDSRNAVQDKDLRHPANNISQKTIKRFSLDRIRRSFKQSAPNLVLLLESMIPKEKPLPGSVAGWRPGQKSGSTQVKQRQQQHQLSSTRARTPSDTEMELLSLPRPQQETVFSSVLPATAPPGPDSESEVESVLDPMEEPLDPQSELDSSLKQLLEHDDEWEDEIIFHSETDPRCFIVVVASILAFMKSQHTNVLQMMIGKLRHTLILIPYYQNRIHVFINIHSNRLLGVHLRGMSCPKHLIKLLSMIGLCTSYSTTTTCLKSLARDNLLRMRKAAERHATSFLYDNINQQRKQRHQRSNKRNTMESGTTGTIIVGSSLGEELPPQVLPASPCVYDVMLGPDDTAYFRDIHRSHLFKVLEGYQIHSGDYAQALDFPSLNLLPVKRTRAYELAAMDIDQATVLGNKQVIEQMRVALNKSKGSFKDLKMILSGDHLTISRIMSLQYRSIGELTYFDRMHWAIPVLQLFHMKMVLSTAILNTHYGHVSAPGSLAYYIGSLGRKLSRDKPCYHTNDEFLRIVFRAMVHQIWRTKEVPVKGSASMTDDQVLRKLNNIVDLSLSNSEVLSKTNSVTNTNALLFIKDMVVYIEFCAAIKLGDIGRLEQILKRLTIMFQSGNNKNYGHELLRLNYNIKHKWSECRKLAVFSSLLMNTAGLPNRWIPSDLYQEHNNLLTKRTHATVGNRKSTSAYITPSIRLFRVIDDILSREFRLPVNSKFHRITKTDEDIKIVMESLMEHEILDRAGCPTRHQAHPFTQITVVDMMTKGFIRLANGGYSRFRRRMEEEKSGEAAMEDLDDVVNELENETNQAEEYINRVFGSLDK